jgi:hypothetical protein
MIKIVCYTTKMLVAFCDDWVEEMYLKRTGWKKQGHMLKYDLSDEDYEYIVSRYPATDRDEEIRKWREEK